MVARIDRFRNSPQLQFYLIPKERKTYKVILKIETLKLDSKLSRICSTHFEGDTKLSRNPRLRRHHWFLSIQTIHWYFVTKIRTYSPTRFCKRGLFVGSFCARSLRLMVETVSSLAIWRSLLEPRSGSRKVQYDWDNTQTQNSLKKRNCGLKTIEAGTAPNSDSCCLGVLLWICVPRQSCRTAWELPRYCAANDFLSYVHALPQYWNPPCLAAVLSRLLWIAKRRDDSR